MLRSWVRVLAVLVQRPVFQLIDESTGQPLMAIGNPYSPSGQLIIPT